MTWGHTIRTRKNFISQRMIRHELVHVRQYEDWGWLRYLWRSVTQAIKHPYGNRPMEIAAIAQELGTYPTWEVLESGL